MKLSYRDGTTREIPYGRCGMFKKNNQWPIRIEYSLEEKELRDWNDKKHLEYYYQSLKKALSPQGIIQEY
jgi:hypothetical protein